ncbi:MAG TPA: hypothetical protein VF808_07535 [Ktedonobacterales bacterium]
MEDLRRPEGRPAPLIMTVVRSPHAPARIGAIDSQQAAALPGVVAFEPPIARIEGKFKLSQNRDATDRAQVADHLAASEFQDEGAVAAAMRALGVAPSR